MDEPIETLLEDAKDSGQDTVDELLHLMSLLERALEAYSRDTS